MPTTALILIDIQNDYFATGKWPVDQMENVSDNAAKLLLNARENGFFVVHIRHEINSDQAPFFQHRTPGADIHASVQPLTDECVILKHRPNSFHETTLRSELDAKGINDVVLCGAMSQMCIDSTARAAADFGYKVTVIENACGAKEQSFNGQDVPAPQVHAAFMAALSMGFAQVLNCESYLAGNV